MKIILIGPPGAGKGTIAEMIMKKYDIPQISTGNLLRDAVEKGTELGIKAKSFMDSGSLVPNELAISLMKERLAKDDCRQGYILDGFPRNIEQAEKLEQENINVDVVINFEVSAERVIERMNNRRTCRKCGSVYNTKTMPPKQAGVCDKCGSELYQRDDQKQDIVRQRMEVYDEKTKPLIDYYKNKGILKDVDASAAPDEVFSNIIKVLDNENI